MIVRNMAALFALRNGTHLGRFAVVAVFLVLLVVGNGWARCSANSLRLSLTLGDVWSGSCVNKTKLEGNCGGTSECETSRSNGAGEWYGGIYSRKQEITIGGSTGYCFGQVRYGSCYEEFTCWATVLCTSQCESDSASCVVQGGDYQWLDTGAETCEGKSCVSCTALQMDCETNGGTWVTDASAVCGHSCSNCDAQCQCEESGGSWVSTNGGYCVPQCQSQFCCDSLNQVLPPEIDSTWEGCVATDPSNDKCVVLPTTANNTGSTQAECTAKSRYRVCTSSYVWNRTAGQCAPVSSNNCVNVDVPNDERCTNVLCEAYQYRSVSALQYNGSTQCYEGLQMVQDMMVCDNGIREERGRSTEAFQVCDSYLEANDITIQDYLSGQNGGASVVGGNSAGTGGGNTSEPSVPCVGNGCSSNPYNGGTSVNAQGDTVQNSASPYLGNVWTPQQQLVTSYDSTTGTTTIVPNSQGGDSTVTTVRPSGIRCLGVSGGVATLTNGYSTWTCAGVMSCSQAVISASINGGACSASSSGIFNDGYNSDKMPLILDSNGNAILTSESDNLERAMQALASVMNGIAHKDTLNRQKVHQLDRNQQDSLWKATFGNDLDAVRNMRDYIASASSANSEAIAQASSANSQAIGSAASKVSDAVGSAASDVAGAVGNVKNAVNSASSANSQAIASATSQITSANSQGFNSVASAVGDASASLGGKIDNLKNAYSDSVRTSNGFLQGILNALDTGGIVNRDLNGIRDAVTGLPAQVGDVYAVSLDNWYNDKLKLTLDENAQKVADAIDSLNLEVKLDSIKIDMPKDSTVDSIYDAMKPKGSFNPDLNEDTTDFEKLFRQGYEAALPDTNPVYDSSIAQAITSINWIDDGSFTDSGYVDSMANILPQKLDSSIRALNARSDSATKAYADTMKKYSGIDRSAGAIQELFTVQTDNCNCFDISVTYSAMGRDYVSKIEFSEYLCRLKLFGNLSAMDLIKQVLRLLTSILCVFMIMRTVGSKMEKK